MNSSAPYDSKMQAIIFRSFLNLLLALFIFTSSEAGRLLGVPNLPLQVSTVWPATGFSLTALLLFGYRSWPGIFLGNFAYNVLHLYLNQSGDFAPFFMALTITLGSVAEALVGGAIVRRYSTPGYFNSVKDMVVFLFFGGVVTCMIGSTVGTLALYLGGVLPLERVEFTWWNIWLGNTMGVYIFAPLLVVWAIHKREVRLFAYGFEVVAMLLVFLAISYFTVSGYPLGYLFVPYNMWVTYRYGLHGGTFAMLFITLATIVPIILGNGPFIVNFTEDILLIIVSFLEIVVAATLVLAATVNERNAAWRLIQMHRLDLIETGENVKER